MANRFFVYEGAILRAAQPKFIVAVKYMSVGRRIFWGEPENPMRKDITNIYNKLFFKPINQKP